MLSPRTAVVVARVAAGRRLFAVVPNTALLRRYNVATTSRTTPPPLPARRCPQTPAPSSGVGSRTGRRRSSFDGNNSGGSGGSGGGGGDTGGSSTAVKHLPLKAFATGALAGAFGSWVGLGGGFVSLPILTMVLRLTQHQAHGTSLCAVTATGFAGVRACVRACVCACVRACVRAWVRGLADTTRQAGRMEVEAGHARVWCITCAYACTCTRVLE
jgi:hypothetical protein